MIVVDLVIDDDASTAELDGDRRCRAAGVGDHDDLGEGWALGELGCPPAEALRVDAVLPTECGLASAAGAPAGHDDGRVVAGPAGLVEDLSEVDWGWRGLGIRRSWPECRLEGRCSSPMAYTSMTL
ncbi:MAG: hypothetical protein R6X02_32405 [Enhygromyxa sp.]